MQTIKSAECLWLKDSAKGWLGNSSSVEFLQQSEAELRMPCHLHVDYEQADWEDKAQDAPECAGRAIHFANRCKKPQQSLLQLKADYQRFFSNLQDFIDHHHGVGDTE